MANRSRPKIKAQAALPRRRPIFERLWAQRLPVAICALTFLLYAPSLFCGFVRDDHLQIVQNPQVQSWEFLPTLLSSHLWSHQTGPAANHVFYRPLFSVFMLLVHTAGGLEPWFWHLASITLHVLATYLVFLLCLRLTGSQAGAAVGAVLFATHPIHVDAVTWVSASNEVLFTIFAIGSLLFLLNESLNGSPKQPPHLWRSALLFAAAIFSKETAFALLPILVVVAWLRLKNSNDGGPWRCLWKASLPYLVAIVAYALARGFAVSLDARSAEHRWAEVVFTSPSVVLFYLKKLVLPLGLSPCYSNAFFPKPNPAFWFELAVILLGAAVVAWLALRYRSHIGLAVAWTLLPILPALAVMRFYQEGDAIHDRYLYAPSVGLSILVATLAAYLWSRAGRRSQQILTSIAIVLATGFVGLTFAQQKYYDNDLAFYRRAIDVNPTNGVAYSALGDIYLDQGQTEQALEAHRKAHALAPNNAQITLLLARALFVSKRPSDAEGVLNQLLQDPALTSAHRISALLSLANTEIALQHLDAAQALLDQVEHQAPETPELHWAKAVLLQREGLVPQAQAEYEREYQITGDPAAQRQAAILARKQIQSADASETRTAAPQAPIH